MGRLMRAALVTLLVGSALVAAAATPSSADVSEVVVGPGWAARSIAVGGPNACVVAEDGRVRCWGFNNTGQLGVGDTENRGDEPGEMGAALPVVDLGPGRTAVQVSAGPTHACALLDDGSVKCWGANLDGQLGVGDKAARGDGPGEMGSALPPVDLGSGRTATAISVGYFFSCALLDDATVRCWGRNDRGQLGQGDAQSRGDDPGEMGSALPAVDLGPGRTVRAISAGPATACAIRDDSSLACWGEEGGGELGRGSSFGKIGDQPGEMGASVPVIDVGPGRTVDAVSVGRDHVCAVLDDGSVKCWGLNLDGALGLGDTAHRGDNPGEMGSNLPAVDLGPGRTATAVSAGFGVSCALLDDGSLRCWGDNQLGSLGLGDTADRGDQPGEMGASLPAVDVGGVPLAVTTGTKNTCVALDDGTVKCWSGISGQGDTDTRGDEPGEMGVNLAAVPLPAGPRARLRADYRFLRSRISSVVAAPNLVDAGPGTNTWASERVATPRRSVLRFPQGNGLDVPTLSSVVPRDHYTVSALFRFDEVAAGKYRRILNYAEDGSDDGLYTNETSHLELYPLEPNDTAGTVEVDEWVQVTITRARLGRLRVYLDGAEVLDVSADAGEGVVAAVGDVLRLFVDDPVGQDGEESSGAIARLRLWNRPLTPAAVAALTELPPAATIARSRASAAQGAVIQVTGRNYGPLEQVRVILRDRTGRTRVLSTARTDRSGFFRRSITIPGIMADGAARITTLGLTSQLAPSVAFRIT